MVIRKSIHLLICLLFLSASCSGGGGGGGSPATGQPGAGNDTAPAIDIEAERPLAQNQLPPDGAGVEPGASVTFSFTNANQSENSVWEYTISLFSDSGMTELVEEQTNLAEDQSGAVSWTPGVAFEADSRYWWRWSATALIGDEEASVVSGPMSLTVVTTSAGEAASPRNGGYMDVNFAAAPVLAAWNAFTGGGVADVAYDFELYADEALTALLARSFRVLQSDDELYTTWPPNVPLAEDGTYYWRARPVINGVEMNWRGAHSFTVRNMCGVEGPSYAAFWNELTFARQCALLLDDPAAALGPPDAVGDGTEADPFSGFVSLSLGGVLVLEMGQAVVDGAGDDILVYEYKSVEPFEVFVGPSEVGPWVSLGVKECEVFCGFDLGMAGIRYTRYVLILDRWSLAEDCHDTVGADIDAVVALNVAAESIECAEY